MPDALSDVISLNTRDVWKYKPFASSFSEMEIQRSFKIVAIDIPGGKRSFVKMIIAHTTALKRAINS